ncbi:MAG: TRAP transporter small permease subunit, partial [Gemmatimonadetes bacterium]|nr:TRAP transporter small permease subunit [Gemmatimonadota bacterium]NIX42963.1 TRAP transporter small permease subunit [Gemmatimonadota bacterium]
TMGTVQLISTPAAKRGARVLTSAVAAAVSVLLARAGLDLVVIEAGGGGTATVAGLPVWVAMLVIPVAFALMAVRIAWTADDAWPGRIAAAAGLLIGLVLGQAP